MFEAAALKHTGQRESHTVRVSESGGGKGSAHRTAEGTTYAIVMFYEIVD